MAPSHTALHHIVAHLWQQQHYNAQCQSFLIFTMNLYTISKDMLAWSEVQGLWPFYIHGGFFSNIPDGQQCSQAAGICPNVSTTPITAMGCLKCLPLSVLQLKSKHCQKPHCRNGVVDTFEQSQAILQCDWSNVWKAGVPKKLAWPRLQKSNLP